MIVISGVVIFVFLVESVGVPHGSLPCSEIFWVLKIDNLLYFNAIRVRFFKGSDPDWVYDQLLLVLIIDGNS